MSALSSIAVYCGSRTGGDSRFTEAALAVADFLVDRDMTMVNGGGSIGLMGVMTDRILSRGGKAIGVIPLALKEKEVAHLGMTELLVVPDMHARKLTIVNLSDAFVALPGGFGTLDELFETLTWSQLHLHNKPVGLLNVDGYYDPLLQMIDEMVGHGFVREDSRRLLHAADSIDQLLHAMEHAGQLSSRISSVRAGH
ncbi:MAG: TIGR00730 family Rossman fold protein [Saprospiraceae bacterium]|nr:TIGR00730 family Rossman fold protein [Saprospiraceae bacterium]